MAEAGTTMARRQRVEDGQCLRVTDLAPHRSFRRGFHAAGELRRPAAFPGGAAETVAWSVEIDTDFSGLLCIEHRRPDTAEPAVSYSVALVAVDRPFGGLRWMWQSSDGDGLVHVLHLPPGGDRFSSRAAHRLVYGSQSQSRVARAAVRAMKLREALGGAADLGAPCPPRPSRMRAATYARHRREIEALTAAARRQRHGSDHEAVQATM